MGKSWIYALGSVSLVVAWLGIASPRAAQAQTEQTEPPPNSFTDAPPMTGPQFAPDPTPTPYEYHPHWELSSELVYFLFRSPKVGTTLLTHGNTADTVPGALNQPNTTIIGDSSNFHESMHVGVKLNAIYWLTRDPECLGIQASGFIMETAPKSFQQGNQGNANDPLLARPFFDAFTGIQTSNLVTNPGLQGGNISFNFHTQMYGADGSILYNLTGYAPVGPSIFILAGPRYLQMNESFSINENTALLPAGAGVLTTTQDYFSTTNAFYGAQIGTLFRYRAEGITFDLMGKISAGNNYERLNVSGFTSRNRSNHRDYHHHQSRLLRPVHQHRAVQPKRLHRHSRTRPQAACGSHAKHQSDFGLQLHQRQSHGPARRSTQQQLQFPTHGRPGVRPLRSSQNQRHHRCHFLVEFV